MIQNFQPESSQFQPVPIGTCGAQQRPRIKERHCHPIFKKYKMKKFKWKKFTGNLHAKVLLALILLELEDNEIIDHFKVCS